MGYTWIIGIALVCAYSILDWILWALLAAGAAALIVSWDDIYNWLFVHKTNINDYAELIKQKMNDGNVKIVAGVFTRNNVKIASEEFVAESLDEELKKLFGNKDKVRIEI